MIPTSPGLWLVCARVCACLCACVCRWREAGAGDRAPHPLLSLTFVGQVSGWLTLAQTLDFSELPFLISEMAEILRLSLTSCNCYEVEAQPCL